MTALQRLQAALAAAQLLLALHSQVRVGGTFLLLE